MGIDNRYFSLWWFILALLRLQVVRTTNDSEMQSQQLKAKIIEGPTVYYEVGSTITLTCMIPKFPEPTYTFWYHNRQKLNYDASLNSFIITEKGGRETFITSRLYVERVELDAQGNYTCAPSNAEADSTMVYIVEDLSTLPTASPTPTIITCGGDIYADSGTIQSPNFPEPYGPSERCMWKIVVPEGHRIALKFDFIEVESDARCLHDYVTIIDGYGEDNLLLKKLCNGENYNLPAIWSSSNKMTVRFVSDNSIQRSGFSATFQKVTLCGGDIVADRGVLQTPVADNIPYICNWNITVPGNNKVVLKIARNENENYGMESFYVSVKDSTGSLLKTFFYLDEERTFRSSTNKMSVAVQSDGSEGLPSFYAEFEKDTCGRDIVADNGIITSHEYPNNYFPNEDCTWRIAVPENYLVLLKFQFFELEYDDSCGYDFVEIRDGHSPDSALLGKFCGTDVPEKVRSTSNTMYVRFVSDAASQYQGFSAEFRKDNATD